MAGRDLGTYSARRLGGGHLALGRVSGADGRATSRDSFSIAPSSPTGHLPGMLRSSFMIVLAATMMLGGCAVGPDYKPRTATELGVPETYSVPAPASHRHKRHIDGT